MNFIPTVFWVTGLSGSGKTTLSGELVDRLRALGHPTIFLDGDVLREIYGGSFGYEREQRLKAGLQYATLCKMLVDQNVHVVCATISMFHEVQAWNRFNIQNYIEIFVDVPMSELMRRDSKRIYSDAKLGKIKNVVGIDILPEFPEGSDIVIKNYAGNVIQSDIDLVIELYDHKVKKEQFNANNMELY